MLSRGELSRFGSGMLTDVFIDRVFEEYQTYRDADTGEREMDRAVSGRETGDVHRFWCRFGGFWHVFRAFSR